MLEGLRELDEILNGMKILAEEPRI